MNRRKIRMKKERKMKFLIIAISALFVAGTLVLNSFESAINIEVQRIEEKVEVLKAERDGLNTEREGKISFDNIVAVAKKRGYTLNYATSQTSAKNE